MDSVVTGAQGGPDPDVGPATGTATSTEAGRAVATEVGTGIETATTGEGLATAHSPAAVSGGAIGIATVTGAKADGAGTATS